jgi:hypothetical protein
MSAAAHRKEETEAERLDRQLLELLNEVRVVMPGVQVLFAFLLTVPFAPGFEDITDFQRTTYFVTLLLATSATAFLMAPTAFHRINFEGGQKPRLVRLGNRQVLCGLALLALAMTGAVMLVTDVLFGSSTVVPVVAGVVVLLGWLWAGTGLVHRGRGTSPG